MSTTQPRMERVSGHESFFCRYGWLKKVFSAVQDNPKVLKDDELATTSLGIGRNMVRSIQFWGESMGIITANDEGGHKAGPLGMRLLNPEHGWDPYLENLESLWLLHWWLSSKGGLAAWHYIFCEANVTRFEKRQLVEALAARTQHLSRALALSTLEQHSTIFCAMYVQQEKNDDDSSWSPFQTLGLMRASRDEDGRATFTVSAHPPVGLTPRVFALALVDFLQQQQGERKSVSLQECLAGINSPGNIFKLDEPQLRVFLDAVEHYVLPDAIKFVDTADTQTIVMDTRSVPQEYWIEDTNMTEAVAHA